MTLEANKVMNLLFKKDKKRTVDGIIVKNVANLKTL